MTVTIWFTDGKKIVHTNVHFTNIRDRVFELNSDQGNFIYPYHIIGGIKKTFA